MKMPPEQNQYFAMAGGVDQITPPVLLQPGQCRDALNFECDLDGGYRRIDGFERYDGRPRPSDQSYWYLSVTLTGSFAVGNTLTGNTSGATSVIATSDTGALIITKLVGSYQANESVKIAGVSIGTATAAEMLDSAPSPKQDAQYKAAAADIYRADIAAVPGSGSVLGVWTYNDSKYAFRNNAGGTAAVMYKATAGGWSAITFGRELSFTAGGTYVTKVGDTITGATSGATATIANIIVTSGSFSGGNAAGRMILSGQTGTFQTENLNVGANLTVSHIAGNSTAITLSPGGRYEFVNYNFGGAAGTMMMYGCDGINRSFQFDGTTFTPISTGMTVDTPSHIEAHKFSLWLTFGSSLQLSSVGTPLIWSPVLGAGELAIGENITAITSVVGSGSVSSLLIHTATKTKILYGDTLSNFSLVNFNNTTGAVAHTVQVIGDPFYLTERGVVALPTTQAYGNFIMSTVTHQMQNFIKQEQTRATASCISRDRNQYRLFFNDGFALYITFQDGKVTGMMPINFGMPIRCVCSSEISDGTEEIYFGSDDGYIYQFNKGTSFDGQAISAYLRLAYAHFKSPRLLKRFRKAVFEIAGDGYSEFALTYELGYGNTDIGSSDQVTYSQSLSTVNWDSFTWDSFYWDSQNLSPSEAELNGTAENISMTIASNANYFVPFIVKSVIMRFTPRRLKR